MAHWYSNITGVRPGQFNVKAVKNITSFVKFDPTKTNDQNYRNTIRSINGDIPTWRPVHGGFIPLFKNLIPVTLLNSCFGVNGRPNANDSTPTANLNKLAATQAAQFNSDPSRYATKINKLNGNWLTQDVTDIQKLIAQSHQVGTQSGIGFVRNVPLLFNHNYQPTNKPLADLPTASFAHWVNTDCRPGTGRVINRAYIDGAIAEFRNQLLDVRTVMNQPPNTTRFLLPKPGLFAPIKHKGLKLTPQQLEDNRLNKYYFDRLEQAVKNVFPPGGPPYCHYGEGQDLLDFAEKIKQHNINNPGSPQESLIVSRQGDAKNNNFESGAFNGVVTTMEESCALYTGGMCLNGLNPGIRTTILDVNFPNPLAVIAPAVALPPLPSPIPVSPVHINPVRSPSILQPSSAGSNFSMPIRKPRARQFRGGGQWISSPNWASKPSPRRRIPNRRRFPVVRSRFIVDPFSITPIIRNRNQRRNRSMAISNFALPNRRCSIGKKTRLRNRMRRKRQIISHKNRNINFQHPALRKQAKIFQQMMSPHLNRNIMARRSIDSSNWRNRNSVDRRLGSPRIHR